MINLSDAHILGAAIRSGRSALSWSQQLLAEKSGISLPTIARIETGVNNPKLETISRLITTIEAGGVEFTWTQPQGFGMVVTLPKKRK